MKERLILVVDDEPKMRRVLEIMLARLGHTALMAANGREALALCETEPIDLVLTDLRMPEMDGLTLLAALRRRRNFVPVVVITAYGAVETAVQAMRYGARDYLLRPFDVETLEAAIARIFAEVDMTRQNDFLRGEVDRSHSDLVGTSVATSGVRDQIHQVGPSKASVLITGETGTGKEVVARAIHEASPRRDRLFVPINCAALPADIMEAELFGAERGAFTGAHRERLGKFEYADGGTVFLDELTEMPLALQSKLLRVLQEGVVERLGGNRARRLDLRFVCATNREPHEAIREGRLREDIYYRLNVFRIHLLPLRERVDDIPALLQHLLRKHAPHLPARIEEGVIRHLQSHSWPGNVRELENMLERALIVSQGTPLSASHFTFDDAKHPMLDPLEADLAGEDEIGSLPRLIEEIEAMMIDRALKKSFGNKAKAAAMLDISERTLWYKLKKQRPGSGQHPQQAVD